jgi:hypothetical protein
MTRHRIAIVAALSLVFASASAEAGRPRMQVLDRDVLSLMPEEPIWFLTLLRDVGGSILLLDQSDASPMRVTPLGFQYPTGSTWGSYTATPDGTVWGAFSSAHGVRVYDLGDLTQPGALAPALLQAEPMGAGFDPRSVQLGIIAILIGVVAEPTPAISFAVFQDGTSNTMMFAWDGDSFEPVVEVGDETWMWDRPQ